MESTACFRLQTFGSCFGSTLLLRVDREIEQGKAVADAWKAAGVQHVVYSGLDPVKEKTGKSCPHYDSKAVD